MNATRSDSASLTRPTHARYGVLAFAMSLAMLTYLHRVAMSQAKVEISNDLKLTNTEMGMVFSAFTLAYALFEVPLGWWGDRAGPRIVLGTVVLWWSALTATTGAAWSFGSLWVCRFLFGAGQAGAFPNLAKALRLWLPREELSWSQGLLWMSARWGGALAPAMAFLAMQKLTWRLTLVLFSFLGVVWVLAFLVWFRNHPEEHRAVNEAELALLPKAGETRAGHAPAPWRRIWCSSQVWLLCGQYFCQSMFFYFLVNWLPSYLREGLQLATGNSAVMAGLPLLLGGMGCVTGGFLLRWATRRFGARLSRRTIAALGMMTAAASLLVVVRAPSAGLAVAAIGFAAFSNDLSLAACWTTCVDIGGRFAGTLGGQMNMWGAFGGFVSPMLIGWLLDVSGQNWNLAFYICGAVYAIGALMWLLLDPVTPLESPVKGTVVSV